jgi:hypothetical protein
VLGNGHAGFGRRSGETHQQQRRQGAPGRPHRSEGKRHIQAFLARARRRVNVLWALLRDGRRHEATPPIPHAAWQTA